jgi:hypothetical protein
MNVISKDNVIMNANIWMCEWVWPVSSCPTLDIMASLGSARQRLIAGSSLWDWWLIQSVWLMTDPVDVTDDWSSPYDWWLIKAELVSASRVSNVTDVLDILIGHTYICGYVYMCICICMLTVVMQVQECEKGKYYVCNFIWMYNYVKGRGHRCGCVPLCY